MRPSLLPNLPLEGAGYTLKCDYRHITDTTFRQDTDFPEKFPQYHKKRQARMDLPFFGDPPGIRTPDPLLKRQLLCQLS